MAGILDDDFGDDDYWDSDTDPPVELRRVEYFAMARMRSTPHFMDMMRARGGVGGGGGRPMPTRSAMPDNDADDMPSKASPEPRMPARAMEPKNPPMAPTAGWRGRR